MLLSTFSRSSASLVRGLAARLHVGSSLLQESTRIAAPDPGAERRTQAPLPEDVVVSATPAHQEGASPVALPKLVPRAPRPVLALADAVKAVKLKARVTKTVESVDICVALGIDPKRSDQVRGVAALPHGTGKKVRVAVFASGAQAEEAKMAGADLVGGEELIQTIKTGGSGAIDFDKAIATPAMMPQMSQIARILGPRGLMPNPKIGTLTNDVKSAVAAVRRGQVLFRADRYGLVHAALGKADFPDEALSENIEALMAALVAAKPKGLKAKGGGGQGYIKSAHLASTMGRGSVGLAVGQFLK